MEAQSNCVFTDEQQEELFCQIAEIVLSDESRLEMKEWHGEAVDSYAGGRYLEYLAQRIRCQKNAKSGWEDQREEVSCGTTHCIAGWAQVLIGAKVEPYVGPMDRFVDMVLPNYKHLIYGSNETALAAMKAALEKKKGYRDNDPT